MLDKLLKAAYLPGPGRRSLYTVYRRVFRPSKQWSKSDYMKPVPANHTQAAGFREYPIKPSQADYALSTRSARRRAALGRA